MNTVIFALLLVAGAAALFAICAGVATLIHKSGIAEKLWK